MALTATIDISATPPTLTVVSDRRVIDVEVTTAGETATGHAVYPVTVTDSSGRMWTKVSDNDVTAVYTG